MKKIYIYIYIYKDPSYINVSPFIWITLARETSRLKQKTKGSHTAANSPAFASANVMITSSICSVHTSISTQANDVQVHETEADSTAI